MNQAPSSFPEYSDVTMADISVMTYPTSPTRPTSSTLNSNSTTLFDSFASTSTPFIGNPFLSSLSPIKRPSSPSKSLNFNDHKSHSSSSSSSASSSFSLQTTHSEQAMVVAQKKSRISISAPSFYPSDTPHSIDPSSSMALVHAVPPPLPSYSSSSFASSSSSSLSSSSSSMPSVYTSSLASLKSKNKVYINPNALTYTSNTAPPSSSSSFSSPVSSDSNSHSHVSTLPPLTSPSSSAFTNVTTTTHASTPGQVQNVLTPEEIMANPPYALFKLCKHLQLTPPKYNLLKLPTSYIRSLCVLVSSDSELMYGMEITVKDIVRCTPLLYSNSSDAESAGALLGLFVLGVQVDIEAIAKLRKIVTPFSPLPSALSTCTPTTSSSSSSSSLSSSSSISSLNDTSSTSTSHPPSTFVPTSTTSQRYMNELLQLLRTHRLNTPKFDHELLSRYPVRHVISTEFLGYRFQTMQPKKQWAKEACAKLILDFLHHQHAYLFEPPLDYRHLLTQFTIKQKWHYPKFFDPDPDHPSPFNLAVLIQGRVFIEQGDPNVDSTYSIKQRLCQKAYVAFMEWLKKRQETIANQTQLQLSNSLPPPPPPPPSSSSVSSSSSSSSASSSSSSSSYLPSCTSSSTLSRSSSSSSTLSSIRSRPSYSEPPTSLALPPKPSSFSHPHRSQSSILQREQQPQQHYDHHHSHHLEHHPQPQPQPQLQQQQIQHQPLPQPTLSFAHQPLPSASPTSSPSSSSSQPGSTFTSISFSSSSTPSSTYVPPPKTGTRTHILFEDMDEDEPEPSSSSSSSSSSSNSSLPWALKTECRNYAFSYEDLDEHMYMVSEQDEDAVIQGEESMDVQVEHRSGAWMHQGNAEEEYFDEFGGEYAGDANKGYEILDEYFFEEGEYDEEYEQEQEQQPDEEQGEESHYLSHRVPDSYSTTYETYEVHQRDLLESKNEENNEVHGMITNAKEVEYGVYNKEEKEKEEEKEEEEEEDMTLAEVWDDGQEALLENWQIKKQIEMNGPSQYQDEKK